MIGNLMQKGPFRLPEIGSFAQPVVTAFKNLRTGANRKSALLASVAGIAIVAVGVAAAGYIRHVQNLADAQRAASRVEVANIDLQDELAKLRDQVAASNRELTAAQDRVSALTEEIRAHPQPQVSTPEAAAAGKPGEKLAQQLHVAEAERATLAARLSKAEADLAQQQAKQNDLMGQINQWQKKLDEITSDRDRLKARVGELEKQSALRHAQTAVASATPLPAPVTAAAAPAQSATPVQPPQRVAGVFNTAQPNAEAPATAAQTVLAAPATVASVASTAVRAPAAVAHGAVDHVARVLAAAGVDVGRLFADVGVNRDEGGPFIPAPQGGVPRDSLTPQKLAALQNLVKTLPVRIPMQNYRVTSPFGERTDPFNGRAAFHPGIDLAGPYGEPVYAAAPGVVTFSGYRSDYGKIVEIDHGHGIVTRYSHLARCTVNVGERVVTGAEVGLEGSTGRSTGPHLLYEIDVNGEPQDPEKFFDLSRFVQAAPTTAQN